MRRGERGLSESVQWAVLVPVLLVCLLGVVQSGVWWHARTTARQAAAAGADTASYGGAEAARAVAARVAAPAGLRELEVVVTDRGTTWEVTVQGRAQVLLDLGMAAVRGHAVAAKEER